MHLYKHLFAEKRLSTSVVTGMNTKILKVLAYTQRGHTKQTDTDMSCTDFVNNLHRLFQFPSARFAFLQL